MKLSQILFIALGAALIAVLSPLSIPFGVIPITLQTLAIGLIATLFRAREAFFAILLYSFLGFIGLPVFQGGAAGFTELFSPRGGYLISFLLIGTLIAALLTQVKHRLTATLIINLVGHLLMLLVGSLWILAFLGISVPSALSAGFIPFILPEVIKASLATAIALPLRRILSSRNDYFKENSPKQS
ncbi:MAG: biotin transporter BioY [Streptococcaceae bacterium]|jgi:biotin transport system substrate-specific component|nr:biotin transporter BioY [Streptococcaceae bacterium]